MDSAVVFVVVIFSLIISYFIINAAVSDALKKQNKEIIINLKIQNNLLMRLLHERGVSKEDIARLLELTNNKVLENIDNLESLDINVPQKSIMDMFKKKKEG